MFDLYVCSPAFGLPSIDPECLAIIAYLQVALPSSTWRLVPGSDCFISPSRQCPVLYHNGICTSGYLPILHYLTSRNLCPDLDAKLQESQQADVVAFSAFLAAHARPLLDLSLYASAANWSASTRPALTALLPVPLTWTVPPLVREAAMKRVEHLGLAELDRDFDPHGRLHVSAGRDSLPEAFRRHIPATYKRTPLDKMTPEQASAIRLHSLAEDCLAPLDAFIGREGSQKRPTRFFREIPVSSLDCLAFGYLILMRDAPVPRSFLRDWLEQKSTGLPNFIDNMKATCLDGKALPWAEPSARGICRTALRVLDSIARNMPGFGAHYATQSRLRAEAANKDWRKRMWKLSISAVTFNLMTGLGLYWYKSLQPFGARYRVWRSVKGGLNQFGEAGSMLSHALDSMSAGSHG